MDDQPRSTKPLRTTVPVCVIGASAGGVTALQSLFGKLPPDLGLAYVAVLHLPRQQSSILDELLSTFSQMPVSRVQNPTELTPDHVYVISPGTELLVEGDYLRARSLTNPDAYKTPIDTLLCSMVEERCDCIAVVLTGAGHDGARGVRAIKEAGGIVLVQDPDEAEYPSMPQTAVETGAADFVEPIARLAEKIVDIALSKRAIDTTEDVAESLKKIIAMTRTRTGHDFSIYKEGTVLRRVRRRAQLHRRQSIAEYAAYVRNHPAESKQLFADLLISVTSFFRDPAAFEAVKRKAIAPLLETATEELRIWVAGCASGEEAYSIAILVFEEMERQEVRFPIQIFATDLDEDALATARVGIYPRSIETDISPERLKRFFIDEGSHYRVSIQIRETVLFATHSVVRDPPFTRLDLAVCRNLLIYFGRPAQQQLSSVFHYALRSGGYLFLGPAEAPDIASISFDVVDREMRIYRAQAQVSSSLPFLPKTIAARGSSRELSRRSVLSNHTDVRDFLGAAHLTALENNAPPSVLVDSEQRLLHSSQNAGRFMLVPGGPPTDKLPALVRPELRGELMFALDRVLKSRQPVVARVPAVSFESERRQVLMYVMATSFDADDEDNQALVLFLDGGAAEPIDATSSDNPQLEEIRRLRIDLNAAQQVALESRAEHEAAVQDLRVANEELQSLNEEYRSTAEELETSKEELQSVNEELHTVNAELRSKVHAVSSAHNDLLNLTTSSEIGTLFLDPDLKIRMFTPPIAGLFNISDVDVGRSITDFSHHLAYGDLAKNVRQVLQDLTPIEEEIRGPSGRWLLLRIRPYRTTEDAPSGVVVTFNDITDRKREIASSESEARFKAFIVASSDVIYRMSADWSEMLRLEGREILEDTVGPSKSWLETYIPPEDREVVKEAIEKAIRGKEVFELEHRVFRRDSTMGWTRSRAVPILSDDGEIVEWLGTAVDLPKP